MSGNRAASGALFRTNIIRLWKKPHVAHSSRLISGVAWRPLLDKQYAGVYTNAISTQSSFWRRQTLIGVPVISISRIHTKSILCCRKIKDQSNSLDCGRFCNIARPGDHAPFLETHGNYVLGSWFLVIILQTAPLSGANIGV